MRVPCIFVKLMNFEERTHHLFPRIFSCSWISSAISKVETWKASLIHPFPHPTSHSVQWIQLPKYSLNMDIYSFHNYSLNTWYVLGTVALCYFQHCLHLCFHYISPGLIFFEWLWLFKGLRLDKHGLVGLVDEKNSQTRSNCSFFYHKLTSLIYN